MALRSAFADFVAKAGQKLNLPELGVSEGIRGSRSYTIQTPSGPTLVQAGSYEEAQRLAGGYAPNQQSPQPTAPLNTTPLGESNLDGFAGNGSKASPTYDTSGVKSDIQTKLAQMNSLYDQLFGDVDELTKSRRSELDANYNQQFTDLDKSYETTSQQLPGMYAARNLSNSSYFDNALTGAADTYAKERSALTSNQNENYAKLGQFAETNKANFGADRSNLNSIDLNAYGNDENGYNSLLTLRDQINAKLGSLGSARAGLKTNQEFVGGLNAIAPGQQQGSSQLAKQLQSLVTSSASQFAKDQIMQGLIRTANLKDKQAEQYWVNYYTNLLNGQQQPAQVA